MATVKVEKIKPKVPMLYKESSSARLSARKIGLDIPRPIPSAELEETDIA